MTPAGHGFPRAAPDADLAVDLRAEHVEALVADLTAEGEFSPSSRRNRRLPTLRIKTRPEGAGETSPGRPGLRNCPSKEETMQSPTTRHRFLLVAAALALLTLAVAEAGWAQAQFQGVVTAINQQSRTLILNNGQRVQIRANTVFDPEGDVFSFNQLVGAFNSGLMVSVEGDGQFRPNGTIVAHFIKAETNA